jgi:hypothetical protein
MHETEGIQGYPMGDAIVDLLPLMTAAAIVPLYSIAVLLLLQQSQGGLLKAIAFVSGGVSVRLVQGILFGLVIGVACQANSEPGPKLIVSTLLLIIGILLLVTAFSQWRQQDGTDTPQWMIAIRGVSALGAMGAGAIFPLLAVSQWVFTLSAIGVIGEAALSAKVSVGVYLVFVLASQTFGLAPIVAYAVAPHRIGKPLQATQAWLERNNQGIVIVVSLIIGAWFLFKGIRGLIA